VAIAVIDSEIDATHPDLEGAVTQRYDAVGTPDKPHPHGTGMGGRHRRASVPARHRAGRAAACGPRLLHQCRHTREHDLQHPQGINWAVNQGVRVINMSFAGPKDPSLERVTCPQYFEPLIT
jgi:subtilisin family serine protease